MKGRHLATVVLLVLLGLAIGFGIRILGSNSAAERAQAAIVLEMDEADVPERVLAYDRFVVPLTFRNGSGSSLTVTRVSGNCACMKLNVTKPPVALESGESLEIEAVIEPERFFGRIRLKVGVECEQDGRTFARTAEISPLIGGGLWAFPHDVSLLEVEPETEIEAVVDLFDAYPDDGIAVKAFQSCDPERLRVESLREFERKIMPERFKFGVNPRADFKHRYRLKLTCRTPAEYSTQFEASITAVPENPDYPPLTIPVIGRTRPPDYDIAPRQLLVAVAADESSIERRLELRVREGLPFDLTVLDAPDFVQVAVNGRYVDVTIRPAESDRLKGEISLGLAGASESAIVVPVRMIRLP